MAGHQGKASPGRHRLDALGSERNWSCSGHLARPFHCGEARDGPGIGIARLGSLPSAGSHGTALSFCDAATSHVSWRFSTTIVIIPYRGPRGVSLAFLSPSILQLQCTMATGAEI